MLDTDTQADGFGFNTHPRLFFLTQLTVRGGRRMTGKALSITNVDQTLKQFQLVVKPHTGVKAALVQMA